MDLKYFNLQTDPLMKGLDDRLMLMSDSAHESASAIMPGIKFIITSGLRTPEQNNSVLKGAVPDSAHLTGLAADYAVASVQALFAMLEGLHDARFKRVGIYYKIEPADPYTLIPVHLHVDIDESKPQNCLFTKIERN